MKQWCQLREKHPNSPHFTNHKIGSQICISDFISKESLTIVGPQVSGMLHSIAVLCSGYGAIKGGHESFCEVFQSKFMERGYQVSVISGPKGSGLRSTITVPLIYREKLSLLEKCSLGLIPSYELEALSFAVPASRVLKRTKPDMVLWMGTLGAGLAAKAFKGENINAKIVAIQQVYRDYPIFKIQRLILRSCDGITALDPVSKAKFLRNGFRTEYIPMAVDVNVMKPDQVAREQMRKKLGLNNSKVVLFLSRLTKNKHLDWAINAVAQLDDVVLLVVGEGKMKKQWTAVGYKKLGSRFKYVAAVPFSAVPQYYNCCDVFTLPSKTEGFGSVQIEALACNKPVVFNLDPIRRAIVGKAGIGVNCSNPREYAEALQMALDKSWGTLPRERSLLFSWEKIANRYEEFLVSLTS